MPAMTKLFKRALALVMALAFVCLGLSTPASAAGTLSGLSFTTSGTGYAATGAKNSAYNWGFTTATAGNLSHVRLTTPPGTTGASRALLLNASTGSYVSTADAAANTPSTMIDMRAKVAFNVWPPPATLDTIFAKRSGTAQSYSFRVDGDGTLDGGFILSDGTTGRSCRSATPLNVSVHVPIWIREVFQADNGSGGWNINQYQSADGNTWTAGTSCSGSGVGTILHVATPLELGSSQVGSGQRLGGAVYYADVRQTATGTTSSPSGCTATGVTICVNPNDNSGALSWTSSSPSAESWTITRAGGAYLPDDIGTDLLASNVSGLPSGGVGQRREIDGFTDYQLATATSIPAGTPCTISLQGFVNTSTPGSYSSTITTYDNASTPAVVDTGTTATLSFAPINGTASASVTIDPSFTFAVSSQPAATVCNGLNAATVTSSSAAVAFGHMSSGSRVFGVQQLTTSSNAGGGESVYLRSSAATANVLKGSGSNSIADSGSTTVPSAGTAFFGYTTDANNGSALVLSGNVKSVPQSSGNDVVSYSSTLGSTTNCVGFGVGTASTTPADTYSAVIIYTAVPAF